MVPLLPPRLFDRLAEIRKRTWTRRLGSRTAVILASVCVVLGAVLFVRAETAGGGREYRIGAEHAPPLYYLRRDGRVEGLAVDALNEAARRTGIRLRWIPVNAQIDAAMNARQIDLWPAVAETPERRRRFHLTEAWLTNRYCLLSRVDRSISTGGDLVDRMVARRDTPVAVRLSQELLPGSRFVSRTTREAVVQAACTGEADAGFVETRFVDTVLLNRPPGCEGVRLHVTVLPGATSDLRIMSWPTARDAADRLRSGIADVAQDGTLATALEKWSSFTSVDARSVYALEQAERRNALYFYTICFMLTAAVILVWEIQRAHIARKRTTAALTAARHANAARSDFLAHMSHEIRTPLNAIIGVTELLLERPLPADLRGDVSLVRHSGSYLLTLLNDILDLSKIEAGQMPVARIAFDLRRSVESSVNLLRAEVRQKGLSLTFEYPDVLPANFVGDSTKISQIVTNFLANAVKFTETGGIRVHVEELSRQVAVVWMRIAVEDTGPGIAVQDQARLFSRFCQLDSSSTRRYGGSGLGLAISKELAELMGGSVGLSSTVAKGSCFWVDLPLRTAPLPSLNANPSGASPVERPPYVLIAEDNHVNQLVLTRSLQRLGCIVEIAENGEEAIVKWLKSGFDLVFMDCQMPEMDGYEAAAKIRTLEQGETHVPIVAVTAHAMADDEARCRAAGMDEYLSKPIDRDQLKRVVDKYAAPVRIRTAQSVSGAPLLPDGNAGADA